MLCSRFADEVQAEAAIRVMIEQGPFVALFGGTALLLLWLDSDQGRCRKFCPGRKSLTLSDRIRAENFDYSCPAAILYLECSQLKQKVARAAVTSDACVRFGLGC